MPTYEVDVGGKTYEVDAPDPNTAWQWANYTHSTPPKPVKQAPFSLKDTAISGAQSAVGAAKSITEAFGAGNAPAEYLEGIQKDLGAKLSPERQAEQQRRAQLEKEAARTGKPLEEIAAGLGGVKEAPIQTIAQGVGSSLPTVILGIGAGALGATLGAPVAIAAGVGIGVKYLIGALQGAGEVKGSVYDAVREGLEKQGMKPEDAKNKAREAQNYMGDNWGTIATAAGLGGVAGGTGLEKELLAKFSKPVAARIAAQAGKKAETGIIGAGVREALPEGAQGGQEQYAINKALQRAGIDTPTWSGVAGAAARDAAMGALTGSAIRPFTGRGTEEQAAQKPAVTPDENGQLPLFPADQLPPNTYKPMEPVPEVTPPEPPGGPKGEQLDLGLEATRNYGDMVKELERLKVAEKTPETEARVADLQQQLRDRDTYEVDRIRGEKVQSESDAAKAANFPALQKAPIIPRAQVDMFGDNLHVPEEVQRDLFGEPVRPDLGETPTAELTGKQLPLNLRRNPEGQPTTFGQPEPTISSEDVMLTAIPLRTAAKWVEKNVVGKTRTQLQSMVDADPTLIQGKDPRAQLLQTLLASEVPAFKEAPSVKKTQAPAAKPPAQPRGSKPSVGVSGEPAGTRVVPPRPAPAAPTPTPPAGPVGLGLVPPEQPAGKGNNAPVAQPSALKPPAAKPTVATETAEEAAQRKADAEAMRRAMEAQDKNYAKGAAKPAPKPAPAPATPEPIKEAARKESPEEAAVGKEWDRKFEEQDKYKNPFEFLDAYKQSKKRNSKNVLPGQTLAELQAEIAADKTSAGKALARLLKSGKVKLVDKSPTKGLGGEFDGKTVTLYADGIPKGHAIAVALHEVGAHMGMKNMLGEAAYQKVADRIIEMAKSKEASPERALAQRALSRIPEADVARGKEVIDDEAIAYFIEELAKAEASGELPRTGALRALWNQIRAALVAAINRTFGTTFGMGELTPEQIGAFASAAMTRESKTGINTDAEAKKNFSVSYTAEQIVNSMGPLDADSKSMLQRAIQTIQSTPAEPGFATKARTQIADVAATVEGRLSKQFNGAVRDSLGKLNPMGLFRQAQDYSKLLLEYFQTGTLVKDANTGQYRSELNTASNAPVDVFPAIYAWGEKNGYSKERATQLASRIVEAVRQDEMRKSNKAGMTNFVMHMKDADIDALVAEYNADKDLQNLSTLMDKPRIALVDHMIRVGRLTPEEGKQWKDVIGYVPFDRIEDFAEKFNKVKKISGKGIAQVGKLPELVGSLNRPVGNVFDNYINTLGWMVGQITKTDATINTLRSLENLGHAKFLGNTTQGKDNTVGAYVGGELQYFQLPSKYDVMAFKDLNPPKAKWLQGLGAFSNILRTTVTAMPPFALKQVTDDIQRAIMTSGVKSPMALVRMSLVNFPKLAFAELRGIQHPYVKEFGALGLTGEFDFQQGKPAASLLADMGYKPRGKLKELLHRLEGITRASDLAVRKAIYDQTMIENSSDALLAQTRAREFINFRRRGASDFVGAMVTTIPFFNAYIQGMDVLYRAASGADSSASINRAEARKMFWNRAATVLALSTLYALGKSEDDDYNDMDLRTRDGNWILGNGAKLPVPTELGALFKVIPERVVEYMRRQGTPEEQEAFEAVRTTAAYIFEQYVGRTVPIPQAAKPLLEAWTNHSFLTGRELEGIHQKGMLPNMRTAANTSELAIAIAKFSKDQVGVEVSPIMVDNALRGYLGSTAATATMITDGLLNPTRMDRPIHKWALVSNYAYDPVGTRRTSEFYDTREKVGQINNTLNELAKTDIDAAEKFVIANQQELALASAVNSTLNQIEQTRAYRKYLDSADAAATMTQEERKNELLEIRKVEVDLVSWLREAKTQLRTLPQ
jgi:hypothetical protein